MFVLQQHQFNSIPAEVCPWTYHKYMCIWLECSHVAIWSYLGSSSWTERWPEELSDSPCLAASTGHHSCCSKGDWLKRQKARRGSASQRWAAGCSVPPLSFWESCWFIPGRKNCGHARRTRLFHLFHEARVWASSSFSSRATHAEKFEKTASFSTMAAWSVEAFAWECGWSQLWFLVVWSARISNETGWL